MWDAETPLCTLALAALLGMWVSPGGDGVDLRRTSGRRTVTQLGRKVGGKRASDLGQLVCSAGVDSVSAVPWREREWHLGPTDLVFCLPSALAFLVTSDLSFLAEQ